VRRSLASHFELIGGSLVAGDSTKLRAQNSKKISTQTNWSHRLHRCETEEYNAALAKEDGDSSEKNIEKKIKKHTIQKQNNHW
jgi:hypothetical protein